MLEIPFLKSLSDEQRGLVVPLFEKFDVPAHTVIFQQGEAAVHLYLIAYGDVAIRYKPYDGPKMTLIHLHRGDFFGWSSVVGNETYTSDAVSASQIEAYQLRGADLRQLCMTHGKTGHIILERLAEAVSPRWKNAREQIHEMLHDNFNTVNKHV